MTKIERDAAHVAAVAEKLGAPANVWVVFSEYDRETAVQLVCMSEKRALKEIKDCIREGVRDGNVDSHDKQRMFKELDSGNACVGVEDGTWYSLQEWKVTCE